MKKDNAEDCDGFGYSIGTLHQGDVFEAIYHQQAHYRVRENFSEVINICRSLLAVREQDKGQHPCKQCPQCHYCYCNKSLRRSKGHHSSPFSTDFLNIVKAAMIRTMDGMIKFSGPNNKRHITEAARPVNAGT